MSPKRIITLVAASVLLAACDAVDSMTEGYSHAEAVSTKLENSLGLKSQVGFNWHNGTLVSVTVTFSGVPNTPSLADISAHARDAVRAEFKQRPKTLVVACSIDQ